MAAALGDAKWDLLWSPLYIARLLVPSYKNKAFYKKLFKKLCGFMLWHQGNLESNVKHSDNYSD